MRKKRRKQRRKSLLAAHLVNRYFRGLEKSLARARSPYTPEAYMSRGLNFSLLVSIVLTIVLFFIGQPFGLGIGGTILIFILGYIALFIYFISLPRVLIIQLKRDVDKQLLFATRHMVISIDAGETLMSTIDKIAKRDYGRASELFDEISRDVKLGKGIEDAIDHGLQRSPSEIFSKLLVEIENSLKIGTDISKALKRLIKEMMEESELSIKRYNKKMNSMTLFYLVIGVVFPSVGIAMLVILSSLSNLNIQFQYLLVLAFFLFIVQAMFLSFYRNLRRSVAV